MIVYKCDRCGKEMKRVSTAYSYDSETPMYYADNNPLIETEGTLCSECTTEFVRFLNGGKVIPKEDEDSTM